MYTRFLAWLALLALPTHAQAAALMGFADSTMLMGEWGADYSEVMLNYSPKIGHALGVEAMHMRDKDGMRSDIATLNYTGLLKRWNLPRGQANFWFTGGLGESYSGGEQGFAYTPSLQFDYETTRLYFLAKARMVRAPGMNFDSASVQGGFSFYEADYEKTQPWFVMEVRSMRNMDPGLQVTPALRLINKDYFLELGLTNPWDEGVRMPRVNFMFVF
jgi:hypothetical protein